MDRIFRMSGKEDKYSKIFLSEELKGIDVRMGDNIKMNQK